MYFAAFIVSFLWATIGCEAFSPVQPRRYRATSTQAALVPHDFLIATIDSDIASMSSNEFAPVFMGGIAVMFGGLLSAIFVGVVVDRKDLSAQIVAESYSQGPDDEEFWKGLSEEEKKKAQELLKRIRDSKGEKQPEPELPLNSSVKFTNEKKPVSSEKPQRSKGDPVDMFDDYSG